MQCDLTQENIHYALSFKGIKVFIIHLLSVCNPFKCFMKTVVALGEAFSAMIKLFKRLSQPFIIVFASV